MPSCPIGSNCVDAGLDDFLARNRLALVHRSGRLGLHRHHSDAGCGRRMAAGPSDTSPPADKRRPTVACSAAGPVGLASTHVGPNRSKRCCRRPTAISVATFVHSDCCTQPPTPRRPAESRQSKSCSGSSRHPPSRGISIQIFRYQVVDGINIGAFLTGTFVKLKKNVNIIAFMQHTHLNTAHDRLRQQESGLSGTGGRRPF